MKFLLLTKKKKKLSHFNIDEGHVADKQSKG